MRYIPDDSTLHTFVFSISILILLSCEYFTFYCLTNVIRVLCGDVQILIVRMSQFWHLRASHAIDGRELPFAFRRDISINSACQS
jgi:hypothetical protein